MTHRNPTIGWLLAIFVVLASSYSITNPLFEAPDEVWHYEFVRWLAEGKGLPAPEDVGNAPWQQEGAQPPLYYLLAAALTSPISTANAAEVIQYNPHAAIGNADAPNNKNMMAHGPWEGFPWRGIVLAVHLVRLLSVLLGTITIYFVWRTAQLIFPGSKEIAWLAATLVALNPQFLFISASVTNDTLVTCCAAVGIWLLLRILQLAWERDRLPPWRWLLSAGVVLGVAALSKVSGLALSGMAGVVLLLIAWQRRSFGDLLRMGVPVAVIAGAIGGWWYWRNWQLFGDPLAIDVLTAVLPGRDQPLRWGEIVSLAPSVWRSYWGLFGWFNVAMDVWLYWCYSLFVVVAMAAFVLQLRSLGSRFSRTAIGLLLLWIVTILALVIRWAQINYPQGRLLFPASGALAILIAVGLLGLLSARAQRWMAMATTALLIIPAIVAPWRWIMPVYHPPSPVADRSSIQTPLEVTFGNDLQLHGYTLATPKAAAGEQWTITLYWSAQEQLTTDYSIFVHLTDEFGILQAQDDSFPAGGSLPMRAMRIGQIYPDTHIIFIPPSVAVPSQLQVDLGVYDFHSGQRLAAFDEGFDTVEDELTIGSIAINSRQNDGSLATIDFADQIELLDYGFDRSSVAPGETLTVNLTWKALQKMSTDYIVFVHLLQPPDAVWAQVDEAPLQGQHPTSTWQPAEIIQDQHSVTLPNEAPPGIYRVEIGLYDPETFERLKVDLEDAGVVIGSVRIE